MSLDKILPKEIISIVFKYKHKFEMIETLNYIEKPETHCMNCDKKKLSLVRCKCCKEFVCFECRYKDLNNEIVDKNTFDLFYECDKCDLENRYQRFDLSEVIFTEDESDFYDDWGRNDWYEMPHPNDFF